MIKQSFIATVLPPTTRSRCTRLPAPTLACEGMKRDVHGDTMAASLIRMLKHSDNNAAGNKTGRLNRGCQPLLVSLSAGIVTIRNDVPKNPNAPT